MKNIYRLIISVLILLIQFGSTGFGYFIKSCKEKNTNTFLISKQSCNCKHTISSKSCCHKENKKKGIDIKETTCCEVQHFQGFFNNENLAEQESADQYKSALSKIIKVYNKIVIVFNQRSLHYNPPDLIYQSVDKNILYQSFLI